MLLSQIQTHSTAGASYLQTRQMSDSTSGIKLALEQEEATSEPHATETIGYMAIEPGSGVWSGMVYETATSDNAITHNWYDLAFDHYYGSEPAFLSSLATYYGYDNSHLRYENLTPAGVQIKVTEDTTADTELNHNSAEAASYFVLGMGEAGSSGSPGLLSAVTPKIPPHVTAFVRDDGDETYDSLETIQFTFDKDVIVATGALELKNESAGGTIVNLTGSMFHYDDDEHTARWDFSGMSPLPAARYTATLDASKVTDISGLLLDGDGDGTAGGSHVVSMLVAVRGDVNLDGSVDISDFNTLVTNYDPGTTCLRTTGQREILTAIQMSISVISTH